MPITPAFGDGLRTEFFIARNIVPQLLAVYSDGLRMTPGADYDFVFPRRIRFMLQPSPGADFVADVHENSVLLMGNFATTYILSEIPQGLVDGFNSSFSLYAMPLAGTVRVYLNGQRMTPGIDYTMPTQTTVNFTAIPPVGAKILVDYIQDRVGVADYSSKFIFNETPAAINPTSFSVVTNYALGTVQVYKNGIRMKKNIEYTELGPNLIIFTLPTAPGDVILADYCTAI
jgi:hypothetical protein